jgi:hypothetical protein
MSAKNHLYLVPLFQEATEIIDARTGRIADKKARRQMDMGYAVFHHLLSGIFDIASRTAAAAGIPDHFDFFVSIDAESPFTITQ